MREMRGGKTRGVAFRDHQPVVAILY